LGRNPFKSHDALPDRGGGGLLLAPPHLPGRPHGLGATFPLAPQSTAAAVSSRKDTFHQPENWKTRITSFQTEKQSTLRTLHDRWSNLGVDRKSTFLLSEISPEIKKKRAEN